MRCNYCNSLDNSIIFEWTRFEKNNILKCNDCDLVFQEINLDEKDIELFYKKEYRKIETIQILTAEQHYNHKVSKKDAIDRIQFISKNADFLKDKNILEIGSASGRLLESLRNDCAKVEGIELNDEYRIHSQKLGINVMDKPIEHLNFEDNYDVIPSFFTIEHMANPKLAIKSIFDALKPNGIFLGEVPNQDDWRISIFDNEIAKRFHYDPNHYYYFSPKTLGNYLKVCGFSKIRFETVERYNSLLQLKNIICNKHSEIKTEDILDKFIFPKNEKDDVRIPSEDKIENEFNRIFEKVVNSELKGNSLRFIATKSIL